ncbi:SDR family NAD(P)-dependent oxidoreductase [Aquimarina sp. W85]|uniref:SDR family NAD(P)-dependent oxidoreductase n=1 Tax=Aquimarina rhodophyticola TaxID=3342246 RepID=UPI00366D981B
MKNVLITGTSRGIGFELAKLFASRGHNVLALSRDTESVEALKSDKIQTFSFDLLSEKSIDSVVSFVNSQWEQIDIIIHNAGLLINKPFSQLTTRDFEKVYHVNVFGVAALTRAMLPFLRKRSHVIAISSMGGIQGSLKFPGLAAYSSSKGAVLTLIELLAEEYKETGIAFNALALGAVQTEMLEEAFPGYKAPLTALEMAQYISDFAETGHKFYNGKILQVSSSTP